LFTDISSMSKSLIYHCIVIIVKFFSIKDIGGRNTMLRRCKSLNII
jgi:hypothetical protein